MLSTRITLKTLMDVVWPTRLGFWLVDHFDRFGCFIETRKGKLPINEDVVKTTLGFSHGKEKLEIPRRT